MVLEPAVYARLAPSGDQIARATLTLSCATTDSLPSPSTRTTSSLLCAAPSSAALERTNAPRVASGEGTKSDSRPLAVHAGFVGPPLMDACQRWSSCGK